MKLVKTWTGYPQGFDDFPDEVTGTITGPYGYDETFTITPDEFGVWEEIIGPLPPGEYTITENPITGWTTTMNPLNGKVNVTVGNQENAATLTITNAYNRTLRSETAWGYLAGSSLPIKDFVNSNNWGWTTKITGTGTYIFDLYAGAGQNIISNGTLVGNVEVIVSEGSIAGLFNVEVTYMINQALPVDYWLNQTHVWIGSTAQPMQNKNKMTNAPGQYNYSPSISMDGNIATVTANDVEGPFWIALHSVVQWWE